MSPVGNATVFAGVIVLSMSGLTMVGRAASASAGNPDIGRALRADICLNGAWETAAAGEEMVMPGAGWRTSRVPALPLADRVRPKAVWYRRTLHLPEGWGRPGRRFFLELEKVGHYAAVFCNGEQVGEHYGQFSPFQAELTGALKSGADNEIAVYVHNASGRYVRPGLDDVPEIVGSAYRPSGRGSTGRNWTGIVGDITFEWRPAEHVADVFVVTSVRERTVEARVVIARKEAATTPLTCRGAVLDGSQVVLELAERPVAGDTGRATLSAPWDNPLLWSPASPKLYHLRVEILRDQQVVDRSFTRFGFREVWIEGRDMLLNGKKLWMMGTYFPWLSPLRYSNDRRALAAAVRVMQAAGVNTIHDHWDDPGRPWLEVCDEMGMLVFGSFFCNGQLPYRPQADTGWLEWIVATAGQWAQARRNHPSIALCRPICSSPKNVADFADRDEVRAAIGRAVRAQDGTRPLTDRKEVYDYCQGIFKRGTREYSDGSRMAEQLAATPIPFITNEIWGRFADVENVSQFFRDYYTKSYEGGATGMVPQHVPVFQWPARQGKFEVSWPSASGEGNRDVGPQVYASAMANWCDPSEPPSPDSPYARVFRELYEQHVGRAPAAYGGPMSGELLVSGLSPDELAFLVPADPGMAKTIGVLSAADGTAWFVVRRPGTYHLAHSGGTQLVGVEPGISSMRPGYDGLQRLPATAR